MPVLGCHSVPLLDSPAHMACSSAILRNLAVDVPVPCHCVQLSDIPAQMPSSSAVPRNNAVYVQVNMITCISPAHHNNVTSTEEASDSNRVCNTLHRDITEVRALEVSTMEVSTLRQCSTFSLISLHL